MITARTNGVTSFASRTKAWGESRSVAPDGVRLGRVCRWMTWSWFVHYLTGRDPAGFSGVPLPATDPGSAPAVLVPAPKPGRPPSRSRLRSRPSSSYGQREPVVDSRGYGDLLTCLFPAVETISRRSTEYPLSAATERAEGVHEGLPVTVRPHVWQPVLRTPFLIPSNDGRILDSEPAHGLAAAQNAKPRSAVD